MLNPKNRHFKKSIDPPPQLVDIHTVTYPPPRQMNQDHFPYTVLLLLTTMAVSKRKRIHSTHPLMEEPPHPWPAVANTVEQWLKYKASK